MLHVAVPAKTLSNTHGSSDSSDDDGSGDGSRTNQRSTPATSVAVTPVESDANKPNKRVSASTRAQQLRESTMSLPNAQGGRKRKQSGPTNTDMDEALARALQAEEYNGAKRPKASSAETDDEENSDWTEAFESPVNSDIEGSRPRDKNGKKTRRAPWIVLGEDSEEEAELSNAFSDDDSEDSMPQRPAPVISSSGSRAKKSAPARKRNWRKQEMLERPPWMSTRVSGVKLYLASGLNIDSL